MSGRDHRSRYPPLFPTVKETNRRDGLSVPITKFGGEFGL